MPGPRENRCRGSSPPANHTIEATGGSALHRCVCAIGQPRRGRSGWLGRSKFHRPVVPDSVRGLSNQLLERTAAGGAFTRWSRGRSTLIVRPPEGAR
jgi:hypothetical protein